MDQSLEKLITWLRNEFIILKRDLANFIIRKISDNNEALNEVAKTQKEIAAELKRQKTLPMHITHEMTKMPAIIFPPFPKMQIPEIKIPLIKLPTINVPKPEVTVNVSDEGDKETARILGQINKKLDALKPFDLWDAVGKKTPLPVILVDENSQYYKAEGGGEGGSIVMSSSGVGPRQLNNSVFGSDRITVTTAGTRVQLPDQPCAEVTITGHENNTDVVVVGGVNVVAANATRKGQPLEPLQSITLRIDNLNKIYIDAKVNGEGATYTYLA